MKDQQQKERPILFSGSMVRAILDGKKTQTRRVAKTAPAFSDEEGRFVPTGPCPYGREGDLLWVRETWQEIEPQPGWAEGIAYRADYKPRYQAWERDADDKIYRIETPWRPAIFMPRSRSRLTLRVSGVRLERLQGITDKDARAEGVLSDADTLPPFADGGARPLGRLCSARENFAALWNEINGKDESKRWAANPWVWALEFRRLEP